MRVEDPTRERVEHRLLEDRHEAGHRHQLDTVTLERVDHLMGELDPVERLPPLDELDGHTARLGHGSRSTRPVDHHHDDGQVGLEDGAQIGAPARREHPDPHGLTLSGGRSEPGHHLGHQRPRLGGVEPDTHTGRLERFHLRLGRAF